MWSPWKKNVDYRFSLIPWLYYIYIYISTIDCAVISWTTIIYVLWMKFWYLSANGRIAYSCITGESESLTVDWFTVESLMGMPNRLQLNHLQLNRLQSNRLRSNHLRSNRLRCYADWLCDRVLLGHRTWHCIIIWWLKWQYATFCILSCWKCASSNNFWMSAAISGIVSTWIWSWSCRGHY